MKRWKIFLDKILALVTSRGTRRTLAGQVLAAAPILYARDAPAEIEAKHIIAFPPLVPLAGNKLIKLKPDPGVRGVERSGVVC
jgi:hypothetical protein